MQYYSTRQSATSAARRSLWDQEFPVGQSYCADSLEFDPAETEPSPISNGQTHDNRSFFLRNEVLELLEEDVSTNAKNCLAPLLLGIFILLSANDTVVRSASKVRPEGGGKRVFPYSPSSVVFMGSALSIAIGNLIGYLRGGVQGLKRCWDPIIILRMSIPSIGFTTCTLLKFQALFYLPADMVVLLDQMGLVLMAILMKFIFKKVYSLGQWISLFLVSIAMIQYMMLRDANHKHAKGDTEAQVNTPDDMSKTLKQGLALMVLQVFISSFSSLSAEKLLKEVKMHFYEQKACMEVPGVVVCLFSAYVLSPNLLNDNSIPVKGMFHGWEQSRYTLLVLVFMMCKLWLAGLISKVLDSVVKQLASCGALLLVYFEILLLPAPFGSDDVEFDYTVFVAIIVVASSIASFVISSRSARQLQSARAQVSIVRNWAEEGQRQLVQMTTPTHEKVDKTSDASI